MHSFLKMFALCIIIPLNIFAQYDLCICTIFQNDAEFLKEWIEFHRIQGVQHFYLYNNNSDDNYKQVLKPYIKKQIVTLTEWPYTYGQGKTREWIDIQCGAYMDCIEKYGSDIKWLAVIDSDEFLFCPHGQKIPEFLENYTQFGGVVAGWLCFGTSDVEKIPKNKLMIEMLTKCAFKGHLRNNRVKSIVQPKYVSGRSTAHTFHYIDGYYAVNVDGVRSNMQRAEYITHEKLRINHYWTRTEKYFRERKIGSRGARRNNEKESVLRAMAREYNKTTNEEILQFVPELRKNMGMKD